MLCSLLTSVHVSCSLVYPLLCFQSTCPAPSLSSFFIILFIFILFSAHTAPHMLKFFSTTTSHMSLSNCQISPHHLIRFNSRTFFSLFHFSCVHLDSLAPPPLFLFLNFFSFLLYQYSVSPFFSSPLLFLLLYSFASILFLFLLLYSFMSIHILFHVNILFFPFFV